MPEPLNYQTPSEEDRRRQNGTKTLAFTFLSMSSGPAAMAAYSMRTSLPTWIIIPAVVLALIVPVGIGLGMIRRVATEPGVYHPERSLGTTMIMISGTWAVIFAIMLLVWPK